MLCNITTSASTGEEHHEVLEMGHGAGGTLGSPRCHGVQPLESFKGYLITEATWQPSTDFEEGGEEILEEYKDRHSL